MFIWKHRGREDIPLDRGKKGKKSCLAGQQIRGRRLLRIRKAHIVAKRGECNEVTDQKVGWRD